MKLKAKIHLENQKSLAQARLAARLSVLKEKGLTGDGIKRDPVTRKIRAEIRKADYRLATIAAQEKLNAEKAKIKAEKSVKQKQTGEKTPAKPPEPAPKKKAKQDKKDVKPEKKEAKQEKKKAPPPPAKSKKQEKSSPS